MQFRLLLLIILSVFSSFGQDRRISPGDFDHFVFSLSWSPEFCYNHPASLECTQHYGFIVHGLWPEFRNGHGPEYCSHAPGPSDVRRYLAIMPDPGLIHHEWEAHGTCSGLDAESYFHLIERAFASIRIPGELRAPRSEIRTTPSALVRSFIDSNPGLPASAIELSCRGPYLQGINICLTKHLQPAACSVHHGCRERMLRITPVR